MKCPYCKKPLTGLKAVRTVMKVHDFTLAQTKLHGDYFAFINPTDPVEHVVAPPFFVCDNCKATLATDINQAKEIMFQIAEDEKNIAWLSA
jgi:hypothetical protein